MPPEVKYRVVCCGAMLYEGGDEDQALLFFRHNRRDGHRTTLHKAQLDWELVGQWPDVVG